METMSYPGTEGAGNWNYYKTIHQGNIERELCFTFVGTRKETLFPFPVTVLLQLSRTRSVVVSMETTATEFITMTHDHWTKT